MATIGRDHVNPTMGVGALPRRAEGVEMWVLSGGEWIDSFHR